MERILDTREKALAVNLDPSFYGTIAEIGAGQEVARWFFRVGGAAGTIAKTMSACDMTVSDQICGKAGRYVSRARLEAMLDHEYQLLIDRLGAIRGLDTRFFVFADTVSARSFRGGNECHGWAGMRFQAEPGVAPSDVLLHVNLTDPSNVLQQEAIGILGVNLIHAAFFRTGYIRRYSREPVRFVVGVSNLVMLFDQQFYEGLPGGLLEGIGKLFAENVKLYVSPMRAGDVRGHLREYGIAPRLLSIPESGVVHPGLLALPEPGLHLYRYLLEVGFLRPIGEAQG